uniref:Uncharacterized protein n=1 Tax=Rhizophora mucronata TaxID=61149 RepID=A0A2P2LXC1_RHIMU
MSTCQFNKDFNCQIKRRWNLQGVEYKIKKRVCRQ